MEKWLRMREPVNTLTHFAMFIAGIVGLVFLILAGRGDAGALVTGAIFGSSVIILYGASSLYHWVRASEQVQQWLRRVDHMSIYVLIAGTYTPILFGGLEGTWRWASISVIWFLALIGIILKIWIIQAPRALTAVLYVGMGWMALIPLYQLLQNLSPTAVALIFAGGAMYTIGAIIYATKAFNILPAKFGFHEVFHLFVMAGTLFHYFTIYFYLMPR